MKKIIVTVMVIAALIIGMGCFMKKDETRRIGTELSTEIDNWIEEMIEAGTIGENDKYEIVLTLNGESLWVRLVPAGETDWWEFSRCF